MILCGGTSKIPKLQSRISSLFEKAEILSTINPDEVIAMGKSNFWFRISPLDGVWL